VADAYGPPGVVSWVSDAATRKQLLARIHDDEDDHE
jgi:hypothetical protein